MMLLRAILVFILLAAIMFTLMLISNFYEHCRKKLNRPHIGHFALFKRFLKKGDYVCIQEEILEFNHIASPHEKLDILRPPLNDNFTIGGELAFSNPNGLGYIYYYPSAMKECRFIYGKYGLKWAANRDCASRAKQMIEENE